MVKLFRLPGVHRPVSDTWLLGAAMCREPLAGASVVDMCTGTGALAIAAARAGAARVVAVDLTRRAVTSARLNARVQRVRIEVRRGDLFSVLKNESFDMIVANPPYIPAESERLPRHRAAVALDAGPDGRLLIERICRQSADHLRPGGVLLMVHSSICDAGATCRALSGAGLAPDVIVRQPGRLGPVMSARAPMMRARGLLGSEDLEEMVVVRGRRGQDGSRLGV